MTEVMSGRVESQTPPTAQTVRGQPFLRFELVAHTKAMLPVCQMSEVITMATNELVPIPNMPAWVMGVHNWRGEILWMVDLGHLVGLEPLYQSDSRLTYMAIVIHGGQQLPGRQPAFKQVAAGKMLGLAVNQVEDMEWCNPDLIQSPPASAVSAQLVPFLRGFWSTASNEIVLALDGQSILAKMP